MSNSFDFFSLKKLFWYIWLEFWQCQEKLATPGLLSMKLFWNNGYGLIIYVHDVTNKISLRDSDYILDMDIWPNFGNSSISKDFKRICPEKTIFWGVSNLANNFGLTLGMNLKLYNSTAKGLKIKVRMF